jgi:hypothetical protein
MEKYRANHQEHDGKNGQQRYRADAPRQAPLGLMLMTLLAVQGSAGCSGYGNRSTKHAHKYLLRLFTLGTYTGNLQPVILDLKAGLLADAGEQSIQVIAFEQDSPSATLTQ